MCVCVGVSVCCVSADLQQVVQVVLWSHGAHGGPPLAGSHLLHQHLDFVELQDAFGPRQVLKVLPKRHQTWNTAQSRRGVNQRIGVIWDS